MYAVGMSDINVAFECWQPWNMPGMESLRKTLSGKVQSQAQCRLATSSVYSGNQTNRKRHAEVELDDGIFQDDTGKSYSTCILYTALTQWRAVV